MCGAETWVIWVRLAGWGVRGAPFVQFCFALQFCVFASFSLLPFYKLYCGTFLLDRFACDISGSRYDR